MSTVFGEPVYSSPERGQGDGRQAPGAGTAAAGAPGAGSAGGYPAGGYGYPAGGYGSPGYGAAGSSAGGDGAGGSGAAGYGPGGYGYGGGSDDSGDGRRRSRRRRFLLAGASAGVAATLTLTGLGVTNAFGSPVLTTAQIQSKVDPALVDIYTTLGYQNGAAAGTGMVLTSSGEVLTNNHVINGATSIKAVDVGNGRSYTAKIVGYDKAADVAVLKLQNASGLKTVTLSSTAAKVGDRVVALGNAGGKGGTPSVATGKVTGLSQTITAADEGAANAEQLTGMTQTNVPIQAGDSGGPLLNRAGEVVGMNTAASSSISTTGFQEGAGTAQTQAFAIPIAKASAIADQIEAGQASSTVHLGATAFLGVQIAATGTGAGGFGFGGTGSDGATIAGVVSGSAADQAGLTAGDQITSVAGHTVRSPEGISSVLSKYHPGDKIRIGWTDQFGQPYTATVTLTAGPAA